MKHFLPLLCLCVLFASCQTKKEKTTTTPAPQPKDTTIIAGVYHFQLDKCELWTLQDVQNTMSASLFPTADKKILKELMPTGEADAAINTFLIKKDGKYILFDAGLGLDKGGAMLDKLIMLNINVNDIAAVCITHCHGDHIGGLLTNGEASFPKADVYCAEKEWNSFKNDKQTKAVRNAYGNRFHTFAEGETILNGIVTKPATGHTPGHTIYEIGNLLIVGDLLHAAALQIPHPEISAKYDMDKKKAAETREEFYQYIKENHKVVAGMHLPFSGVIEEW